MRSSSFASTAALVVSLSVVSEYAIAAEDPPPDWAVTAGLSSRYGSSLPMQSPVTLGDPGLEAQTGIERRVGDTTWVTIDLFGVYALEDNEIFDAASSRSEDEIDRYLVGANVGLRGAAVVHGPLEVSWLARAGYMRLRSERHELPAWTPLARDSVNAEVGFAVDYVGSSRVDLQACKLEYSIVSPK